MKYIILTVTLLVTTLYVSVPETKEQSQVHKGIVKVLLNK